MWNLNGLSRKLKAAETKKKAASVQTPSAALDPATSTTADTLSPPAGTSGKLQAEKT